MAKDVKTREQPAGEQEPGAMDDPVARAAPPAVRAREAELVEETAQAGAGETGSMEAAIAFAVVAAALFVAALSTGRLKLAILAVAFAAAALRFVQRSRGRGRGRRARRTGFGRGRIGMGASVAKGALVEPGATVEMGADVKQGATIRAGAVVRMGASVGRSAVVERDAVVGWGASVGKGAVIGERARVGAGASVGAGARVPPDFSVRAGADYSANAGPPPEARPSAPPAPLPPANPDRARTLAACRKLDQELHQAPAAVREFLTGSGQTIARLQATCTDLAEREQKLRAEADPLGLAQLDEERRAVEKRAAGERDEHIQKSLQGALFAIDEQRRQRGLLQLAADRLQAEQTRLLYTVESLLANVVRMRTASDGQSGPDAALEESMARLRTEVQAVAEALEQVSAPPPAEQPG